MKHSLTPYLKRQLKSRQFLIGSALLAADGLVFGVTNPQTAPVIVLIIGFLLLVASTYYVLKILLALPAVYGLKLRHKRRLVGMLTILAGTVVALQSIGQLEGRDILVLGLLATLLYLYLSYARETRQPYL